MILRQRILLQMEFGEHTAKQMAEALNMPLTSVSTCMSTMAHKKNASLWVARKKSGSNVYTNKPQAKSVKVNPNPRYVPEFKELTPHDHDIYAGRDLALAGR